MNGKHVDEHRLTPDSIRAYERVRGGAPSDDCV